MELPEGIKMKKILFLLIFSLIGTIQSKAQIGIGASGGMIYPGFSKSEKYSSEFNTGAGYDFFVRHRLIKISNDQQIDARYSISNYFSDNNFISGDTRFYFSYLSIDVQTKIKSFQSFHLICGAGMSLVNVNAENRYIREITETALLPYVITGAEYQFNQDFNIFVNCDFQIGEINAPLDVFPVNGFRLVFGGTMFLSN